MRALRDTFGDAAKLIPIANTKGLTGHTMSVGVEDAVALRCLQKQTLPPIPNLRQPDPDFADLNLSKGGPCDARYALRLAAGFGSQIVMALYKSVSREENRIVDLRTHRTWLQEVTGYQDPVISVENRTLKVMDRPGKEIAEPAVVAVQAAAVAPPSVASQAAPARVAAALNQDVEEVRQKILSLLSDKTGYPADMLDTGLDLEADLGIDTVKQAEFISEVRDAFGIPRIEGLKIADFPTIEHIITFVLSHVDRASAADSPAEAGSPMAEGESQVREKILALLSEKTGYPPDMLDTGLDLEADLGIDTVKQAEFISEVREAFGIPRIEGLKIADFPTINHIIGFVLESRNDAAPQAAAEASAQPTETAAPPQQDLGLFEARLVNLPTLEKVALPDADEVIVYGGPPALAEEVEAALRSLGYASVTRRSDAIAPDAAKDRRVGVVNLYPMDEASAALTHTLELYVSCAKSFDQGPAFLVTAVSEDGALGFESPTEHSHVVGTVCGATKAFGREYPETRTHVLDMSPSLDVQEVALAIGRSLSEDFPLETAVGPHAELRAVRFIPGSDDSANDGLKQGDVVLVTGGARGITAECIRVLAQRHPLTIVIMGRTTLSARAEQFMDFDSRQWDEEKQRIVEQIKRDGKAPTPIMVEKELSRMQAEAEVYRTIRELRSMGSEVMYRSVDVRERGISGPGRQQRGRDLRKSGPCGSCRRG